MVSVNFRNVLAVRLPERVAFVRARVSVLASSASRNRLKRARFMVSEGVGDGNIRMGSSVDSGQKATTGTDANSFISTH